MILEYVEPQVELLLPQILFFSFSATELLKIVKLFPLKTPGFLFLQLFFSEGGNLFLISYFRTLSHSLIEQKKIFYLSEERGVSENLPFGFRFSHNTIHIYRR